MGLKELLTLRLLGAVMFGLAGFLASVAFKNPEAGTLMWMTVIAGFAAASIVYAAGSGVLE